MPFSLVFLLVWHFSKNAVSIFFLHFFDSVIHLLFGELELVNGLVDVTNGVVSDQFFITIPKFLMDPTEPS